MIYPRLFAGFGMLVFFTNLILMGFWVRYLALFVLFSVTNGFNWLWRGSLCKSIQSVLEFFKGPFLVLHFPYYRPFQNFRNDYVIVTSAIMEGFVYQENG